VGERGFRTAALQVVGGKKDRVGTIALALMVGAMLAAMWLRMIGP
jgi:hypothetical protein